MPPRWYWWWFVAYQPHARKRGWLLRKYPHLWKPTGRDRSEKADGVTSWHEPGCTGSAPVAECCQREWTPGDR
jgi:hypothetical protein